MKGEAYFLKCGHVKTKILFTDHLFNVKLELYHEHNAYHVRMFKNVVNSSSCDRIAWEVLPTLKEANKVFNLLKKEVSSGK
jgi:hypothetical protein